MKKSIIAFVVLMALLASSPLSAETEAGQVYAKLPVREITVFKDGHAFVLHEGSAQTNDNGDVVLDELPNPIMGTFWAYSSDARNKLQCVISSRDKVDVEKTAMTVEELLKVNAGKQILFRDSHTGQHHEAAIIRVLEDEKQPGNTQGSKVVLLRIREGIKAIPVNQIQNITFLETPADSITRKETKETMTLKLKKSKKTDTAPIGMAYIQRGIRWIPSYRVEIDGKGKAVIKLQGTIVNELADLNDVSTHLVIGVPTFTFKDTPDPISFQETVAQLSRHFRPDSQTAYAFSNAIMTQRARFTEVARDESGSGGLDLGPELKGMKGNEDLFVFTLEHITLKKGQRMVLPIAEYTLDYEDIYTVDINFAPPLEMRRNFNTDQHLKLARLFHAPKAMHKIRLQNKSDYPLTTAPATIFIEGRILAQGMMKFTSIGGTGDLEITTALDIKVKNADEQALATPNAVKWNGDHYTKVDMAGFIELTNYSEKTVKISVKRSVLGNVDEATQDGTVKQLGHGYDGFVFEGGVPFWWNWCSWPWWWYHFNSIGQTSWDIELEPKEEIKLDYNWHYYWR
ncbi:MAG: hypothetical protein ACYTFX_04795 [Planctomycetota bacterium]|jgi:hypothetical protein